MLCKKNGTVRKLFFLHLYIFVKGQLFYKNIFCKKTVILLMLLVNSASVHIKVVQPLQVYSGFFLDL